MKIIYIVLLLLSPALSWSVNIPVGESSLEIPQPKGFSPVTPQMEVLYEVLEQYVPAINKSLVNFIPTSDIPAALKDEASYIPRRFSAQAIKSLIGTSITSSDFSAVKYNIKSQNDEILKKAETHFPETMEKANDAIKDKYDIDIDISAPKVTLMPVHEETGRTLSYSSLLTYHMTDEQGKPAPLVVLATTTFVHVKGMIIYLYSYAEESDLEWSQEASRKWANDIVIANPSGFKAAVKEALPSSLSNID